MIELTNIPLFKDLTSIITDNGEFDIHNDYNCYLIDLNSKENFIKFFFKKNNENIVNSQLCLFFQNARILNFNLFFDRTEDTGIINNFYRGRFEKDNILQEYEDTGERFFHIEFEEGDKFEIFAKKVILTHQYTVKK
jgi:hypothetical protein